MPEPISASAQLNEADLLTETGFFMRFVSGVLRSLVAPARALRCGLAQTTAYKRVDSDDAAQDEPAWDLAGTLEVMLEEDLERMSGYLSRGARQAAAAARARRTQQDDDDAAARSPAAVRSCNSLTTRKATGGRSQRHGTKDRGR